MFQERHGSLFGPFEKFLTSLLVDVKNNCQLNADDVRNLQAAILVTIRDTKTKNGRSFTLVSSENSLVNYVELFKRYISLRTIKTDHNEFIITYSIGKCTKQPGGINIILNIPEKMLFFLISRIRLLILDTSLKWKRRYHRFITLWRMVLSCFTLNGYVKKFFQ